MKKILLYTDCFIFGGCENMIPVLLEDSKLNSQFKLSLSYRYSSEYELGLKQMLKIDNHDIHKIKLPGFKESRSITSRIKNRLISIFEPLIIFYDITILFSHFKKIKPDIIYINNGGYPGARSCRSAVIVSKMLKVKKIYLNINNIAEPYNTFKRFLQFPLDILIKSNVTKYITASEYAKKKLIDVLNLKKNEAICLINSFKRPEKNARKLISKKIIRFNQKTILIGCVGILSKNKGHFYLIEAIRLLKETFRKNIFKVILIGSGPDKDNLIFLIKKYQIQDYISIVPYQKNIFNYYLNMDIYVHPSIAFDDLPFAIREAMSTSLPIIASNFAGIPELVEDGRNGILVPPKNEVLLAKAINNLILDRESRIKMGKISKTIFQNKFSKEVSLTGYRNFFNI